jgi:hypothetical protein
MALINKFNVGITLKIVNEAGTKDSVNIQPKGRITLSQGWKLDPHYSKEYAEMIIDTEVPLPASTSLAPTPPQKTLTQSSSPSPSPSPAVSEPEPA